MNKIYITILVILLTTLGQEKCLAQKAGQQPLVYKGNFTLGGKISLDSLTRYVHRVSKIRFSFNSSKVKGSKEIIFPKRAYSYLELLEQIKKSTSLYYSFYKGYVIFQDNPPKQKPLAISDKTEISKTQKIKKLTSQNNIASKSKNVNEKNKIIKSRGTVNHNATNTVMLKEAVQTFTKNINLHQYSLSNNYSLQIKANPPKSDSLNKKQATVSKIIDAAETVVPMKKQDTADTNKTSLKTIVKANRTRINNKELDFHFGLQWHIPLPLQGTKHYFIGTNGESQPYYFLFPAVWINKFFGYRHEIFLLVIPTQQYFAGNKTLNAFTGPISTVDSNRILKTTALSKTSGFATELQYNYHMNSKWQIGIGLHYMWQQKALLSKQIIRLSDRSLLADSLYGITRSSADWQYLTSSFIAGKLEVAYNFKRLQIGSSILVPLSNLPSNTGYNFRPINGQLFLRWRIK